VSGSRYIASDPGVCLIRRLNRCRAQGIELWLTAQTFFCKINSSINNRCFNRICYVWINCFLYVCLAASSTGSVGTTYIGLWFVGIIRGLTVYSRVAPASSQAAIPIHSSSHATHPSIPAMPSSNRIMGSSGQWQVKTDSKAILARCSNTFNPKRYGGQAGAHTNYLSLAFLGEANDGFC